MEYTQALMVGKLVLLDELIKVAHNSMKPPDHPALPTPKDDMPVWFTLLGNFSYPYAMQRSWIQELEGDGTVYVYNDNTASDPQVEHFDKLATYYLCVSLDKAHKLRNTLFKGLPSSLFDGSRHLLPSAIQASLQSLGLEAKIAMAAEAIENDPKNEFGSLRIDANDRVKCNGRKLEIDDRYLRVLRYFIRYPGFHQLVDIARNSYPVGEEYTFKTTHLRIAKYISDINKILDHAAAEVGIELRTPDKKLRGYQLVHIRKKAVVEKAAPKGAKVYTVRKAK